MILVVPIIGIFLKKKPSKKEIINDADGTEYEAHPFFEASSIRKDGDRYIFVYSSRHNHELCYAVSHRPDGDFQFGGTLVSLGDLFLDGNDTSIATVVLDGLNEDARIGIFMLRPGMFVSSITEELVVCFFSNHDDHQVVFDGNKLTLETNSGE